MKELQGLFLGEIRDDSMDKYKRLFSNTLIFAIGTFGSKLLVKPRIRSNYTNWSV